MVSFFSDTRFQRKSLAAEWHAWQRIARESVPACSPVAARQTPGARRAPSSYLQRPLIELRPEHTGSWHRNQRRPLRVRRPVHIAPDGDGTVGTIRYANRVLEVQRTGREAPWVEWVSVPTALKNDSKSATTFV